MKDQALTTVRLVRAEQTRRQQAQILSQRTALISVPKIVLLLEMWDSEMLNVEICAYLGISSADLRKLVEVFQLGKRRTFCRSDISFCGPLEKAKRAAEVRRTWTEDERARRLGANLSGRWTPPPAHTSFQYQPKTNMLTAITAPIVGGRE